jgi:signal transduction histidine kinase
MAAVLSPPQSTHAGCHAQAKAGSERIAEALAKRVEQLEAVRIVTAEITQELDLTTLLRLITQRAVELVEPAASGVVYLWDEAEQVLVPRAWHGYGEWLRDIRIRLGESIAGTIAQSRAGLLVNDYQTSPYAHPVIIAQTGATAVLGEPLLYDNQLVGVIALNNGRTGQSFTTQDQELLTIFGAQAAIAIERTRLYESLEARLRRLQTLTHLNQVVSSSLDMDEVLSEIARAAATLMNAVVVSFWLVDEAARTLEAHTFSDQAMGLDFPARQLSFSQTGVGWVATHRRLLNIPDVFDQAHFVALDWCRAHNLRSFLALPVLHNGTLLAVLALNGRQPFHLSPDNQYILDSFVTQATLAIENAHLFAEMKQQTVQLEQTNAELQRQIIERQQAEDALRRARDELETRVEERTMELRLANAQLQRSNGELQDFAYVASHDLQEPLRKILSFGDRLKARCGEALSEQGRDYLERMQSAAQRMQTLITDLLTFSRVTTKAQPFMAVDLARVARDVVTDLEVRLEQTGGRVDIGELPAIEADPLQMRQLFQNLIGNALKFHRPGAAQVVSVQAHPVPSQDQGQNSPHAAGARYQITITDNGIGFDEKYLDRIFNVFQRLHNRSHYEGTGIGLAICRKIVERHGGSITATSTPGQGATFIVTLPGDHAGGGDNV